MAVSTHSHPKVAAIFTRNATGRLYVSTHSHPKVAAQPRENNFLDFAVSTHSHPKVAAQYQYTRAKFHWVSTHSHPKVAANKSVMTRKYLVFQHTATRRWLLKCKNNNQCCYKFQHTATRRWLPRKRVLIHQIIWCFNTQPPEGGCTSAVLLLL